MNVTVFGISLLLHGCTRPTKAQVGREGVRYDNERPDPEILSYKEGSDIDLTIKGALLPFSELMEIEDQIDDLYLPYGVDLSQYAQLKNQDLISHIDRLGAVFYRKNYAA